MSSSGQFATAIGALIALVVTNFVLIIVFANIISGCNASGLGNCEVFSLLWIMLPTIDILAIWKIIYPLFTE